MSVFLFLNELRQLLTGRSSVERVRRMDELHEILPAGS